MIILIGNNLGERQRHLNAKVAETAEKKIDFEEVNSQEENCDVDKLYKIDLASRYKNINYILDVLKCGDVFYITRALKCLWLYNDECSNYINSDYLADNVFPHMSMKMQRKALTTISVHLRNAERAIDFYTYCIDYKLIDIAYKFLVLTPDHFKLSLIEEEHDFVYKAEPLYRKYLIKFINNSFQIALAYIRLLDYSRLVIYRLRFLYSVSDEWYLNILEKYEPRQAGYPNCLIRLGLRISKDILNKHKNRVITHPELYINKLNKNMLIKYLTSEDVKSLAPALLPKSAHYFWSVNYYHTYKFMLDKISTSELFAFLKKIFNSKFRGKPFELALEFYKLKYYEMLTVEEREAWALVHIKRDEELPGIENYIWYRFVSFKNAFKGIKRYIFLTPNEGKRSQIVNILPETSRSQEDLINILDYYYERHVNESEIYKESFINKVIELNDLYSLDIECWTLLDKLFYSLDVYTSPEREAYKARSLIYHVLHNKVLPEAIEEYINYTNFYNVTSIIDELSVERNKALAIFLLNYYAEKNKSVIEKHCDVTVKDDNDSATIINDELSDYVYKVLNVIHCFKRKHDECPQIVLQYIKSNMDYFIYSEYSYLASNIDNDNYENVKPKFIQKTEGDFVRWLKLDVQKAIDGICEIRCNAYRWNFRLCRLFRKLKVYFPDDVRKKYLEYFEQYLSNIPKGRREYRNIKIAVVAVFYLADEEFKVTFMDKNAPVTPKIDHMNIDSRLLQVQKAICRLAYHSRPPLPLASVHKYITGDYVHYFLPIFNNYLSNLPSLSKFIEVVLDAPLSIQKHGLRLAFRSYSPEILKPIIIKAWQNTKNISLRKLLYETLFDRIMNECDDGQNELYEVLKLYTSELNHNDHDNVYLLLVSDYLPDKFKGDFIETAWYTVRDLSNNTIDMVRKLSIICHMEKYIHLVQREFPRIEIINDHVHDMFHMRKKSNKSKKKMKPERSVIEDIIEAKWNLTAKYIVSFNNKEEQQRSLQLMSYILNNSIAQWDTVDKNNIYVWRKFICNFIENIGSKEPKISKRCIYMVPIYRCILDTFTKKLEKKEIYLMTWELKLSIAFRKIVHTALLDEEEKTNHILSKGILSVFGKKVGAMVKSQVEKHEFHHSFYDAIADVIKNVGKTICDIFSIGYSNFDYYTTDTLTDIKIVETHILALSLLPTNPPYDWNQEHSSLIKKIKEFDTEEVHSFLHNKYVLSDYHVRKLV